MTSANIDPTPPPNDIAVRRFHQILLWPLRLMRPRDQAGASQKPWQVLRDMGDASPWREVVKEYTGDREHFHERHYNEFVTFLPYVQRFLYGEPRHKSASGTTTSGDADRADRSLGSPMRVFRREDIAQVRVVTQPGLAPILLDIKHVDLYFFYDVDLVLLNVEVSANDLTLTQAQELLYRFGRGYPSGWDAKGEALHCLSSAEWLDAAGDVLARSDAQQRDAFLQHVSEHRAPRPTGRSCCNRWSAIILGRRARCAIARLSITVCQSWGISAWTSRARFHATTSFDLGLVQVRAK